MAENENSSASEKLTFLLIGAGIGATLALLFAPKSGRELRGDIADYTRRGVDAAGEGARQVGARASELYDTTSGRVQSAYGSARERVSQGAEAVADIAARQKDQIQAAIEAGKQAYREEKRKAGDVVSAAAAEPEV
jgi:gas vesicle protein